jgi:PP-loop superfamily ATP-utilizing enzyme
MPGYVEGCFHGLGFTYVTLDLAGYQTGSMDVGLR